MVITYFRGLDMQFAMYVAPEAYSAAEVCQRMPTRAP